MDPEDVAAAARGKAQRRSALRKAPAGKAPSRGPSEKPAPETAEKRPSKSALQGLWGEKTAEEWLVRNAGLKPLGRRVKVGRDEIDLVMEAPPAGKQPGEIVFVEVKTRTSGLFGGGIASVDRRKRHAVGRAAARWMMRNADRPMRIDVVEVYGDCGSGRVDRVVHREAAVPLEKRFDAVSLGPGKAGKMKVLHLFFQAVIAALAAAFAPGCASAPAARGGSGGLPAPDPATWMARAELPDMVNWLPPPPATNDLVFAGDAARYEWGKSLRDGPRGERARADADYSMAAVERTFSPVVGIDISETGAPELWQLLALAVANANRAGKNAKSRYMRPRPYMATGESTLVPEHEDALRGNGSYPSGHTALGWGAALVLVELFPEKQDDILRAGYEYGQSRVIAGFHWQSDVDAARLSSSAAVARLHAEPAFAAQIARAKAEIGRIRAADSAPDVVE